MSTNQDTDRLVTFLAPDSLISDFQAAVKRREQTMAQALRLHMRETVAAIDLKDKAA